MNALTHERIDALKARLDERHEALLRETRDELEQTDRRQYAGGVERAPVDEGDQAVAVELADLNLEMMNRHLREIREIDAARARIEDGSYGTCAECGRDIGFERLLAQPMAPRCRDCQEQWEKTHARDGPPKIF